MSSGGVLLLGSTDLTRSIADALAEAGVALSAVMSAPAEFRISYSPDPVRNTRHVDLSAWCAEHRVPFAPYATPDDIVRCAQTTHSALALVAGWYHMVPSRARAAFARGCVGVHASLLPRYRGGAPLTWALLNGDQEAGVSLFSLTDGVDDGELLDQRRFALAADEYIGDVVRKAEGASIAMVVEAIPALLGGRLTGRPQQGTPSYSLQREPADGAIDWRNSAAEIARLVRSVSRPYPGARTSLDGALLVIWRARVAPDAPKVLGVPGQVVRLDELPTPAVVTGQGLLLIEEIEGPDRFDVAALGRCHQRRLQMGGH